MHTFQKELDLIHINFFYYTKYVKDYIVVIMIEMIIVRLQYDNQLMIVTRLIRMVKLKID